jgi:hypothetical protein
MNRRQFELALLCAFAPVSSHADRSLAAVALEECLSDPAAAAAMGELYLRRYPEHASREALLEVLALPAGQLSRAELGRALEHRIRADFMQQRTLLLDGWLLSRAEAAVCGLVALG